MKVPKLIRNIDQYPDNGLVFYLNIYNVRKVLKSTQENFYFTFDGIGLCVLVRLMTLFTINPKRLAPDLDGYFRPLLKTGTKKVLIGSHLDDLELIKNKYTENVVGQKSGYCSNQEIIDYVVRLNLDASENYLFIVGVGSPRQENLAVQLSKELDNSLIITCGAFFSQYARSEHYYPSVIARLNLRMPYRLFKEKLFSRLPVYFINPLFFIIQVFMRKISL